MTNMFLIDKRTMQFLFWGVLGLAFLNFFNYVLGMPYWIITQFIYLGVDNNIPAWYSSMLFAVAAIVAWECFVVGKSKNLSYVWQFLIFAALMLILSCDEVSKFHETLGEFINKHFGLVNADLAANTPWIWVGAPIAVGVFAVSFFMLKKILSQIPGSLTYLGLGFALIILGGVVLESSINWLNHNELQWVWEMEIIVEESLEMIGTLSIAYAFVVWRNGQTQKT